MKDLDKFKNEMNLSGQNVYVGHRYVPKIFGEWDKTKLYEPLSIVQYQGASFTSRQYVPVGVEITNGEYWASTGNYNAQVEQYRQDVQGLNNDLAGYKTSNNEVLTKHLAKTVNVSTLTVPELKTLAIDYDNHLDLNLDVDLELSEDVTFSNSKIRTDNGSQIILNNASVILQDDTDLQGVNINAVNSPTKPNVIIKRANEAVSGYINQITIDNVYIQGHPEFTANAFEIHGSDKGMIGIMARNIYTRDHNIIFDFYFASYGDWTNANVFENVFAQRMQQMVNYRPYGINHPSGTHFTSNLFSNVGGNGSSIYRKLSNDTGLNRYVNCFIYDLEQYNNLPNLNRVGLIRGVNNNNFLMQNDETPVQLAVRNQNVLLLGYFDNKRNAPLEAFLKLSFFKAGVGIETIIWLSRDVEGNLVVKNKNVDTTGWYNFYTAEADDGSMAVYMHYTSGSWVRPKYHDRNDFTISHMGGMIYTKEQLDAIESISEKASVTHDATIF